MAVQVTVENTLPLCVRIPHHHLGVEDGWMEESVGLHPLPVQIDAEETASIVPIDDAITVQHRDDLEDEVVPQFNG